MTLENLKELVRLIFKVRESGLVPVGVLTYKRLEFSFLPAVDNVLIVVFSSEAVRLSLLEILFVSKTVKVRKGEGYSQAILRLIQKCCVGNEEAEILCRGRDFRIDALDFKFHLSMVDTFYRENSQKLKECPLIGKSLEAYKRVFGNYPESLLSSHPLINLIRDAVKGELRRQLQVNCQRLPIIVSGKISISEFELLLTIWLYQRGFLPLEEVLQKWMEVFKDTEFVIDNKYILYLLSHYTILTSSGLRKYLLKLKRRVQTNSIQYEDKISPTEIKQPEKPEAFTMFEALKEKSPQVKPSLSVSRMLKLLNEKGFDISCATYYRKKRKTNNTLQELLPKLIQEKKIRQIRKQIIRLYAEKRKISLLSAKRWLIRKTKKEKILSYEDYEKLYKSLTLQV